MKIDHSDLAFLPKTMKIDKCQKLVYILYSKKKYVIHIKVPLDHGLILQKVHRSIEFNQQVWLKPYMEQKTIKKTEKYFYRGFFKLMNNSVFRKTMENVRKQRDIKLVTIDKRRSYLASEPNYPTIKCFLESLVVIEMDKINVKMNKSVY